MSAGLHPPYLLFLGDVPDRLAAKTAIGIAHWKPEWCVGQWRLPSCNVDLGLPDLSLEAGLEQGAKTLAIGVANRGGVIHPEWLPIFAEALKLGYHLANGLHERLSLHPDLARLAQQHGRSIVDVRYPTTKYPVANGNPRVGKRLLAVGTDCSVGKMFSTLALTKALQSKGIEATFRATGQTGIFIAGEGVPVDAVVADFMAGAIEQLTPANSPNHWDIVEGQGSLFHPSFSGVSLALLHGCLPDALLMCHEPTRTTMRGVDTPIPDLGVCLEVTLKMAQIVNPKAYYVGIAVNTHALSDEDAHDACTTLSRTYNLPCLDPIRHNIEPFIERMLF